jgi:hypothetical protein
MNAQRGQILPLLAVCLAVLLGFAGISVDVGYLEFWQQRQQSATDAAALGGAQSLAESNCGSTTTAASAATSDGVANGFLAGQINPVTPPATGPYAGNACAVSVQISSPAVSTFFAPLFGYASMAVTTSATAVAKAGFSGTCIYLLSQTTRTGFNGATLNSPGCSIAMNDNGNFNNGTIAAPFIGYAQGTPNYGGTKFTLASPMPMLPVADPCPEIPGCAYLAAHPPPATNCQTYNSNGVNATLNPGCYNNLNLDPPGTITLNPGVYVINGNFNNNGVTLTGTGVTLYVTQSGTGPNLDYGPPVSLSPPTTGNYANVLYYQVPGNSTSINFNGSNVNMNGLIYAPSTTSANFDDNFGSYVVLVFGAMNFNQNNAYDFASPPPGQSLIKQAVLAQ